MESMNVTLTPAVLPPATLDPTHKMEGASPAQKEQFAKDFESVFIEKLMDEMKNTIGDWGFEQDGASQQVHGLFWMQLARDVSNHGGMGMWKDIYQSMKTTEEKSDRAKVLNNTL